MAKRGTLYRAKVTAEINGEATEAYVRDEGFAVTTNEILAGMFRSKAEAQEAGRFYVKFSNAAASEFGWPEIARFNGIEIA
jgi:hypothetical protein